MKILKIFAISISALIGLVLIVALVAPSEYAVSREVVVVKSRAEVFDYVKQLKNQDNFSVWARMDPNMKKSFTGTDGTVGFVSAWESDNPDVGKGEQEIVSIKEGERIDYELRFLEPFEANDDAYIVVSDGTLGTVVNWGFRGEMEYPMNLMLLFMDMEEMLGSDLQEGLNNLKEILE